MVVGQLGVGEIVLSEQVDVSPGPRGVRFDGEEQRGHLNDREHHNPPEIRNDILKLHDLEMDVVNHGMKGRAPALFDLATEIEDQLSDLSEALENIQEAITKLTDLQPDSLRWGD